ncbi:MAG: hypothetical protein ABSB66_09575 [Candidatus Acidiferrales bacterium]|jgi:hypothetical protein
MPLWEFHDQPWFPAFLRDYFTDALQSVLSLGRIYRGSAPRLNNAFQACEASRVVDLCSGGSGPWLWLHDSLHDAQGRLAEICLTDLYPNTPAFERIKQETHGEITYWPESVDATKVPAQLVGFRTIFSSFHHFPKPEAIGILQNAVDNRQGIGIFEAARRHPLTIAQNAIMFFGALLTAPFIRPFRFSRLFWTYILPVIPFLLFYDGVISSLRAYSTAQLREMIASLNANGYVWEVGQEPRGFVAITYLLGYPVK